jgi:hypothetical protein
VGASLLLSVSSDGGCGGGVGSEAGFGLTSSGGLAPAAQATDIQTPVHDNMNPQDVLVVTTSLFDSLRPSIPASQPAADAVPSALTFHPAPLSDAGGAGGDGGGEGGAAAAAAAAESSVPLPATAITDSSALSSSAEEGRHPEHSTPVPADSNDDLVEGWTQVCGQDGKVYYVNSCNSTPPPPPPSMASHPSLPSPPASNRAIWMRPTAA